MRPCGRCGSALENRLTVCPACGATQDGGPRGTPSGPPPAGRIPRRILTGLAELTGHAASTTAGLVLPAVLAFGAVAGYVVHGGPGALVGSLAVVALLAAAWFWTEV